MRAGVMLLVLAGTCALGGCRREPASPLAQEQFVEIMVALRRAALESPGQADFDQRKEAILRRAGVTEAQLRAYARYGARDAPALSDAYDSIAARVQRYHEPE